MCNYIQNHSWDWLSSWDHAHDNFSLVVPLIWFPKGLLFYYLGGCAGGGIRRIVSEVCTWPFPNPADLAPLANRQMKGLYQLPSVSCPILHSGDGSHHSTLSTDNSIQGIIYQLNAISSYSQPWSMALGFQRKELSNNLQCALLAIL